MNESSCCLFKFSIPKTSLTLLNPETVHHCFPTRWLVHRVLISCGLEVPWFMSLTVIWLRISTSQKWASRWGSQRLFFGGEKQQPGNTSAFAWFVLKPGTWLFLINNLRKSGYLLLYWYDIRKLSLHISLLLQHAWQIWEKTLRMPWSFNHLLSCLETRTRILPLTFLPLWKRCIDSSCKLLIHSTQLFVHDYKAPRDWCVTWDCNYHTEWGGLWQGTSALLSKTNRIW